MNNIENKKLKAVKILVKDARPVKYQFILEYVDEILLDIIRDNPDADISELIEIIYNQLND